MGYLYKQFGVYLLVISSQNIAVAELLIKVKLSRTMKRLVLNFLCLAQMVPYAPLLMVFDPTWSLRLNFLVQHSHGDMVFMLHHF